MFQSPPEMISHEEPKRSSGNLLAESICSVGYDLARIYCAEMNGEEVLERRCDLGSDEDFVYCARWYNRSEDAPSMRSDMIFYREKDQNFRLHILSSVEIESPDAINLSQDSIVDGRRSLEVWRKLVARKIPHSDSVLDPPTGFEDKRASINLHYPSGSWKLHTQAERAELASWDGTRQLDSARIELLHQRRAVSLFRLLGERCRVSDISKIVDYYRAQIDSVLEPEFSQTFSDARCNQLEAGAFGQAVLRRKRHEFIDGVSWSQVRNLARQAERLSTELEQAQTNLSMAQRYLFRLPWVDVSVSGITASRLVLCFNSFDSQIFEARLGKGVSNSADLTHSEAREGSGFIVRTASRLASQFRKTHA